jgi:hypothetical protein
MRLSDQFSVLPTQGNHDGPVQLPMFMRGTDLKNSLTMTGDNSTHGVERVFNMKAQEATGGSEHNSHSMMSRAQLNSGERSLKRSIGAEGVKDPVQMIHTNNNNVMGDGHHRAAAAAAIEDEGQWQGKESWVPVTHTDARSGTKFEGADTPNIDVDPLKRAMINHQEFAKNTGAYNEKIARKP